MWRRGTLNSPGHHWFASRADAEIHAGVSVLSRATTVHPPGRVSKSWSVRLLIAYSILTQIAVSEDTTDCQLQGIYIRQINNNYYCQKSVSLHYYNPSFRAMAITTLVYTKKFNS